MSAASPLKRPRETERPRETRESGSPASCASASSLDHLPSSSPRSPADPLAAAAVAWAKGSRPYMEDRHVIINDLGTLANGRLDGVEYFSVFDGHGGSRCADYLARDLHVQLVGDESLTATADEPTVRASMLRAFAEIDRRFLESAKIDSINDGATALCVLRRGCHLDVSNVGDTRAVLGRRRERGVHPGTPERAMRERELESVRLSVDHTPNVLEESERIQGHGGQVKLVNNCWRVMGPTAGPRGAMMLAVSRAFGDKDLKESVGLVRQPAHGPPICAAIVFGCLCSSYEFALLLAPSRLEQSVHVVQVSCAPHVLTLRLTSRDQFVILATDGLWDVVGDAEAVRMVERLGRSFQADRGSSRSVAERVERSQAAADALLERALKLGSQDNVTVLVLWLSWDEIN